jgi:hypothetical protein
MIVTIAKVTDLDRFLEVFATTGADKRREHGCRGSRAFLDPGDRPEPPAPGTTRAGDPHG